MDKKDKNNKKTQDIPSKIFAQETDENENIKNYEIKNNQSFFREVTEVHAYDEGIETTQTTTTKTDPADSSNGRSNDDNHLAGVDKDPINGPPGHLKSFITKISWPGPEHFHSNESILLVDNPNIFKSLHRYIAGGLIALIGIFLTGHYLTGATNEYLQNELPFGIMLYATQYYLYSVSLVIVLGIAIVLWAHIERLHTWYFVTDQRSWVRKGVLSQQDHGSLDHTKVNNVEEENPFPMNRWDVGHVRLFTAASDGSELEFSHIKNPTVWKSRVRDSMMNRNENDQSMDYDME